MAYLQEIRITEIGVAPVVGSTTDPNIIFIVPIHGKVCDMYLSDNDGVVGLISEQIPIFEGKEEALTSTPLNARRVGKPILVMEEKTDKIPIKTEEGFYVLDEDGNITYEVVTKIQLNQYTWVGGIEDVNFISSAPSLEDVMQTSNRTPADVPIILTAGNRPNNDTGNWVDYLPNEIKIWSGLDGTNLIMTPRDLNDDISKVYYANVSILGMGKFKRGQCNVVIGLSALVEAEASFNVAIGANALRDYKGGFKAFNYAQFSGTYWGASNPNIGLGCNAGRGLEQGSANVYLGSNTIRRPPIEEGKLVIHSTGRSDQGSSDPNNAHYPLIFGDFKNRWFELSGKIRLNKKQNVAITDFTDADEMPVFVNKTFLEKEYYYETEMVPELDENGEPILDGSGDPVMVEQRVKNAHGYDKILSRDVEKTYFRQMETVDSKEYFLQQIEAMSPTQIDRLKVALGIETV